MIKRWRHDAVMLHARCTNQAARTGVPHFPLPLQHWSAAVFHANQTLVLLHLR
jgi:hypothetical protein